MRKRCQNSLSLSLLSLQDYEGQRKAERIFQTVVLLFAVVGFGAGYVCERFSYTVITLAAGFLISCLLTLPPWPMYRTKPLKWQKKRSDDNSGKGRKKT